MAKRNLHSSAFALPGLTTTRTGSRKPLGIHNTKQREDGYSFVPKTHVSRKFENNSDQLNDRTSLVDEQGVLFVPQTVQTLEHLTKSRPRSPGRRSPSPSARRKLDDSDNANGYLDPLGAEGNAKKATKHQRDFKSDQVQSLDERPSFSPSLIITNDVGLSVSSAALAKPSPKTLKSNGKNYSGKLGNLKDEEVTVEGQIVLNETTTASKFSVMVDNDAPPPVPSVPPPLEDDFFSSGDSNPLHEEVEHLSQVINANRPCKTDALINSKLLTTKLDSDRNHISKGPDIESLPGKRQSMVNSTSSDKRISGFSSREANAGLTRVFSEDTTADLSGLPRDGTLDKKVSLDSRISPGTRRKEESWSSRQRNTVDKGQSARRRRFKPVTLSDDLELNNADNPALNQDFTNTMSDLINPVSLGGISHHIGTQGPMHGHPDKISEIRDPVVNSVGSISMDRHGFMGKERSDNLAQRTSEVQQFSNRSPLFFNGSGESAVDSNHLFSFRSEKNELNTTTTPETAVVFEYDNSSVLKKIIGGSSTDNSMSNNIEMGSSSALESKEKSVAIDGAVDNVDTVGNANNRSAQQLKHPSLTLPKVVIEYDGEIITDPVIDGYITAETSSENPSSLLPYSLSNAHADVTKHEIEGSNHALRRSDHEENVNSNDALVEDLEDLRLKQGNHKSVEPQEGGMEKFQETGYFDKEEDGLMYQPAQVMTEPTQLAEDDEILFHPPPMFASSDEAEGEEGDNEEEEPEEGEEEQKEEEDEEEEEDETDFGIRSTSPAIPSSLLEEQTRDDRPFHNLPLEAWTEQDCIEWLEFIGLDHFTGEFTEHHVDGRMLKNVNLQLLEEIGINSPDEREVILSEIYRRFHPEEEDMFEMEVQDAFESATEQEKMKIMAVLNALRSPVFQAELGMASSTGSSSPRDSEAGFHATPETASLSGSMTGSDDLPRDDVMPPPPPPPTWTNSSQVSDVSYSARERSESRDSKSKEERMRKISKGKERSVEKERKSGKHGHKHKKHKGVSKLLDSLSLGSSSSKLTKLFHSSSSSKKLNPAMQYLLQAGPQGLVRIWPMALSEETNYCSFLVSMTTTCKEVIKLVFDKYEPIEDPRRFYICEVNLGKGGAHQNLFDDDCPLLYQCRWQDPEKYRFELRCRDEGVIKMLFELDEYEDDLDYRSIPLSMKTPCSEALSLIVKKFTLPGVVSDYFLMEVSEENEDDREEVADHVCPLPLQRAWSAPDHVFRLCRRAPIVRDEIIDSGGTEQTTEDILQEPNIYPQSEASSVLDDLESAAEIDDKEGDAVVEDTTPKLMEEITEFEESVDQSDSKSAHRSASEKLTDALQELVSKDLELQELRSKSNATLEKDREIENLKRQNEELRRRNVQYGDITVISKRLGEKERDVKTLLVENEELRKSMTELQEKSSNEILMRDQEIERLCSRNNELCSTEKELHILREKSKVFDSQEEELEKLRQLQHETSLSQDELVMKLEELQNRHNKMSLDFKQVEELKRINRELCQNVDEGEVVRQELKRREAEVKEVRRKIEELERRNKELEGVRDEVESLKKENLRLAVSSKDAEEMKKNVIKLSAQLREMESHDEVERLRKTLEQSEAEKQQLVDKVAKLEKQDDEVKENSKEMADLKLENIFLVERAKELDELKNTVAKLTGQVRENESFRQKYKELRDVESYLTKQTSTLENAVRQKDKKLRESENTIKNLTEAVKDMEAKLEEQEQNRLYLDQLLSMLKDRDPALLHLMNSSLASSEPEEWC